MTIRIFPIRKMNLNIMTNRILFNNLAELQGLGLNPAPAHPRGFLYYKDNIISLIIQIIFNKFSSFFQKNRNIFRKRNPAIIKSAASAIQKPRNCIFCHLVSSRATSIVSRVDLSRYTMLSLYIISFSVGIASVCRLFVRA